MMKSLLRWKYLSVILLLSGISNAWSQDVEIDKLFAYITTVAEIDAFKAGEPGLLKNATSFPSAESLMQIE